MAQLHTCTLPGEHDGVDGAEHVHKVVSIDQSPIAPAATAGDLHRLLRHSRYAEAPLSVERDYSGVLRRPLRSARARGRSRRSSTSCLMSRSRAARDKGALQRRRLQSPSAETTTRGVMFFTARRCAKRFEFHELGLGLPDARPIGDDVSGGEAQRIPATSCSARSTRSTSLTSPSWGCTWRMLSGCSRRSTASWTRGTR